MNALPLAGIALVTLASVAVGVFGLRISRTTSDFYVASRSVSPRANASAISGEYLSAASFLGVAGLVLAGGADMLWFPVGYTVGYLVLLVLVAAPLRRSGAYTLADFAEARLGSTTVRRVAAVLVVAIGWLYLWPQLTGAGITLRTATGLPTWVGSLVVTVVVGTVVASGGMRSITLVQAFQYWVKLTAIALPAMLLLAAWHQRGAVDPLPAGVGWVQPYGARPTAHGVYQTYSIMLALFLGTMGLPHVLVRFYTNPDGGAARRTTLTVLMMLSAFYLFPPVYGVLGRLYTPDLVASGHTDSVALLLPERLVGGTAGQLLGALVAAGAFAAFLSTSSGLAVSVCGVLDQDLLRTSATSQRGRRGTVPGFRTATVVAVGIPFALSSTQASLGLADTVGLAFAVAASTFCPLLVLGIWWPRLSSTGAVSGLLVGGLTASAAVLTTVLHLAPPGWPAALMAQPAAWSIPLALLTSVVVSLATPSRVPAHVARIMVRLHTPESVHVDRRVASTARRSPGTAERGVGDRTSRPGDR
ncbi:MAG TPA: cation acetate symporter [Actinomycetales bacterium]|nr:cation acetate symporter [Actinomycetales bacterium]